MAAGPARQPRWHKYEIEGLGDVWGFTVDRVTMPSESATAVVKQEQDAVAAGPSRQPRWHKYEIEGLGEVWGFTVDRVPELAPVKQEELAADHDPPARPFASPPVHPQLDRCPPCCACRLPHAPARTVRVRSIRLSARRRGVKHEARSENVVMPKFRPRKMKEPTDAAIRIADSTAANGASRTKSKLNSVGRFRMKGQRMGASRRWVGSWASSPGTTSRSATGSPPPP